MGVEPQLLQSDIDLAQAGHLLARSDRDGQVGQARLVQRRGTLLLHGDDPSGQLRPLLAVRQRGDGGLGGGVRGLVVATGCGDRLVEQVPAGPDTADRRGLVAGPVRR